MNDISIRERIVLLRKLQDAVLLHQEMICQALQEDLGKCEFEAVSTEIAIVHTHIKMLCRNLKRWSKPKKVSCSFLNFPARGEIRYEPYGRVLIFSAWNYPFLLAVMPVAGAIAAGNRVVLKPSEQAPATSKALLKVLGSVFPSGLLEVREGGPETSGALLREKFDFIDRKSVV